MTRVGTGREGWAELVELYEYRVADTLQGKVPRGGRRSLAVLREELLSAPLEGALHRRLLVADRQYLAHRKADRAPQPGPAATATPPALWNAPPGGESAEAQAWRDLHLLAWGDAAHEALRTHMLVWQREPGLLTLQVLYTALENAERAGQAGLAGQVSFPVPAVHDPLTDLDNFRVLQTLTEAVVTLLSKPAGRARLELALSQVHELPFPRHPDEDVLRAVMEAAEREPLAPHAREMLIQALRTHQPAPRDPRERPAIREAVRALARSLEPLLRGGPQSALGRVPHHSVLYAAQPNTALAAPDDSASELMIRLPGGQGTRWRSTDFRWQALGPQWQLQAGEQLALLRPQNGPTGRCLTLELPHARLRAFVSGAYLLLRAQTSPHEDLNRLTSLGRVVAVLLDPGGDYEALRLARAAAQQLRGSQLDAASVAASSSAQYTRAAPDRLLAFARKGAETLCTLLALHSAHSIQQVMRGAARPLGLTGDCTGRLVAALTVAIRHLETPPTPLRHSHSLVDLPPDGGAVCTELRDDPPLTLQFGARAVTLRRDFRGQWMALLPGHPPLTLKDLMVTRGPGFSLILARHGDWLAAAAPADG